MMKVSVSAFLLFAPGSASAFTKFTTITNNNNQCHKSTPHFMTDILMEEDPIVDKYGRIQHPPKPPSAEPPSDMGSTSQSSEPINMKKAATKRTPSTSSSSEPMKMQAAAEATKRAPSTSSSSKPMKMQAAAVATKRAPSTSSSSEPMKMEAAAAAAPEMRTAKEIERPSVSQQQYSVAGNSRPSVTAETPEPSVMASRTVAAVKPLPKTSMSMPFMERPLALDGTVAGDVGFDPLGFAKTKQDLLNYREAEVKHARLAMLAAAGWPLSELWDKKIAALFGLPAVVDNAGRAPSILNGGLEKISPVYWIACLLLAGAIDFFGILKARASKNDPTYFPGNLGFDPLGLYPKDAAGQKEMQLKEIKNGRLAMIAITGFAAQEFVSKVGVINQTPIFFKPIGEVLRDYANSGYY